MTCARSSAAGFGSGSPGSRLRGGVMTSLRWLLVSQGMPTFWHSPWCTRRGECQFAVGSTPWSVRGRLLWRSSVRQAGAVDATVEAHAGQSAGDGAQQADQHEDQGRHDATGGQVTLADGEPRERVEIGEHVVLVTGDEPEDGDD